MPPPMTAPSREIPKPPHLSKKTVNPNSQASQKVTESKKSENDGALQKVVIEEGAPPHKDAGADDVEGARKSDPLTCAKKMPMQPEEGKAGKTLPAHRRIGIGSLSAGRLRRRAKGEDP